MIFSGIIWNAAYEYSGEILSDMSCKYKILSVQPYNMGENYQKFVKDIYQFDNMPDFRLNAKIEAMQKFQSTNIVFIDIDIPNLTKEFMPRKQRYTFIQVEQLKDFIRKKYSNFVKPYFFDIIFHMTDTEAERQNLSEVISRYNQYKIKNNNSKEK